MLFKLHSPRNFIVGGGFFSHFTLSPLSFAWEVFQNKNGAHSFAEMRERVWKYRKNEHFAGTSEEIIGCILLQQPFFFAEDDWIPVPDWPRSIVRGKGFDTANEDGQRLWQEVQARLKDPVPSPDESVLIAAEKYGKHMCCFLALDKEHSASSSRIPMRGNALSPPPTSSTFLMRLISNLMPRAALTLLRTAFYCARTSTRFSIEATSPSHRNIESR